MASGVHDLTELCVPKFRITLRDLETQAVVEKSYDPFDLLNKLKRKLPKCFEETGETMEIEHPKTKKKIKIPLTGITMILMSECDEDLPDHLPKWEHLMLNMAKAMDLVGYADFVLLGVLRAFMMDAQVLAIIKKGLGGLQNSSEASPELLELLNSLGDNS